MLRSRFDRFQFGKYCYFCGGIGNRGITAAENIAMDSEALTTNKL